MRLALIRGIAISMGACMVAWLIIGTQKRQNQVKWARIFSTSYNNVNVAAGYSMYGTIKLQSELHPTII